MKISINRELTAMHREVLDHLNSIHGALLRMNRSIQAEGTFGIMKYDHCYQRIVRRGMNSVTLEVFLVSVGHNLHKLFRKLQKNPIAACSFFVPWMWGKGHFALFLRPF